MPFRGLLLPTGEELIDDEAATLSLAEPGVCGDRGSVPPGSAKNSPKTSTPSSSSGPIFTSKATFSSPAPSLIVLRREATAVADLATFHAAWHSSWVRASGKYVFC